MDAIAKYFINKYGQTVKINIDQNAPPETTKAFIQPSKCEDHRTLCGHYIGSENLSGKNYIYVGLPDIRLDLYPTTAIIQTETDSYKLKKAETITAFNQIIFIRAVLSKN